MEVASPRIRSLLRQAQKTARSGKRAAARQLYETILEEAPDTVDAWLGLAEVARDPETQREAYRQVLELDPDNDRALQHLGQSIEPADLSRTPKGYLEEPEQAASDMDGIPDTRRWLEEATRRPPREQADGPVQRRAARPAPVQPAPIVDEADEGEQALICYRHPGRETGLRCYTCNRPICTSCARHTPVGYRCPPCIREAQDVFFGANILDYLLAGVVSLILGVLAGAIAGRLGFFVIFIGPAAGTLIGRIAFRAARRHHGRYLAYLVAAMVAVGGFLPSGLPLLLALFFTSASLASVGFGLLWPALYVFLATGAAYYQVK